MKPAALFPLSENPAQTLFYEGSQCSAFVGSQLSSVTQKRISNLYGSLHMGICIMKAVSLSSPAALFMHFFLDTSWRFPIQDNGHT